jgi:hypothetical protein
VDAAVTGRQHDAAQPDPALKVAHSATYETPYWAVAGLKLRSPVALRVAAPGKGPLRCEAAGDALEAPPAHPRGTVWEQRRDAGPALIAFAVGLAALAAMAFALGAYHTGPFEPFASMAKWQAMLWLEPQPQLRWGWIYPRTAVLLDFVFIAAYAYLLALPFTRAFARLAGLQGVSTPPRRVLNVFGLSLTLLVAADIVENLATLAWLTLQRAVWEWVEVLIAVIVSLAWYAKWIGLAGCLMLCVAGLAAAVVAKRGGKEGA